MKYALAFLIAILTLGCATFQVPSGAQQTTSSRKLGSLLIPQQIGDFWGNPSASTPFAIKDTGAVVRDTFDTAHGVAKMGGGGTDFALSCGPLTGQETVYGACWSLPTGTSRSSSNPIIYGDGSNAWMNTVSTTGIAGFTSAGSYISKFAPISGTQYGLWLGQGAGYSTANFAVVSDASSFTGINAPTSGSLIEFFTANSNFLMTWAGGTQNSIALGANIAAGGHIRSPGSFAWMGRKVDNSADRQILQLDGSGNEVVGDSTYNTSNSFVAGSGGSVQMAAGIIFLSASSQIVRDTAGGTAITGTIASTGATTLQVATGVTSFAINWAAAAGAGSGTSITGQGAGGTNDGGSLTLAGGPHAGAGTVDASVKITTPLNPGFLSFTPVNGAQALTNAQSDANFVILNASASATVTITSQRRAADTSCVWVRNNTTQTVNFQFLSGTPAVLLTLTSAMVCSDGVNAQSVMKGTWLEKLPSLRQWSPIPENDNDRPVAEQKEAA
jgi:hypothetical protein